MLANFKIPAALFTLVLAGVILALAACAQNPTAPGAEPTSAPSAAAETKPAAAGTPTSAPPAVGDGHAYSAFWQAASLASTASAFGGAPLPAERGALFSGSGACAVCHTAVTDQIGADISFDKLWRSSMLANAARDPYWQATVRSEVNQAAALAEVIEKKCATCHTPMAEVTLVSGDQAVPLLEQGLLNAANPLHTLAVEGVSCTLCHQVQAANLGTPESLSGGYQVDTQTPAGSRVIYGSYQTGRNWVDQMQAASGYIPTRGVHMVTSETCGTCHDLYTPYLDSAGKVAGEFAEQLIYSEWLNSAYAGTQSCQSCHMPRMPGNTRLAVTGGPMRPHATAHILVGGNAYMARLLQQNGEALQVVGTPEQFNATIQRTIEQISTRSARLSLQNPRIENGTLQAGLLVENLAGHKFPAGFPSRRAWLHIRVLDKNGSVVFESGAVDASGAIQGNDNDADAARYEPHYSTITSADQVQIYEGIMSDTEGQVTTTLLRGAAYIKDNRLLPAGFKTDANKPELNPQGKAAADANFAPGSHLLSLQLPLGQAQGPFTLEVNLLYQTVAYRWAQNLIAQPGAEVSRFAQFYAALPNLPLSAASASAVLP